MSTFRDHKPWIYLMKAAENGNILESGERKRVRCSSFE